MSRQAILEMISAAEQDEVLHQKLQAAGTPDRLAKIAGEHGYEFTADDLIALVQKQIAEQKATESSFDSFDSLEELSDDEAEMVAGGVAKRMKSHANSFYHKTGIWIEVNGDTDICGQGRQDKGREFYANILGNWQQKGTNWVKDQIKANCDYFELIPDAQAGSLANELINQHSSVFYADIEFDS